MNLDWLVELKVRGCKGHVPVDTSLPSGIVEAVEDVQEHRANVARIRPIKRLPVGVEFDVHALASVPLLKGIATTPDSKGEDDKNDPGDLGSGRAANTLDIEQISPDTSGENLSQPVEKTVQCLGAGIEVSAVHGILLVDVKPVGNEEHGEEQDHEGFESEGFPQTGQLGFPAGVLHENDAASILTDNVAGVAEEDSEEGSNGHQHDEADVRAVRNSRVRLDVDVLAEGDQAADDSAHVEDCPEPGKVLALLLLVGVGDHDRALGRPEKTGANTQPSTGEQVEACDAGVNRDQQADCIEAVSNATEGKGPLHTELVDKGSAEDTENCECAIQSGVLFGPSAPTFPSLWIQGEGGFFTMLSASVASVFPPPPKPPSALNIPGHMKHTKATMRSCTLGDAYQGIVQPKIRRCLYFHPDGKVEASKVTLSYSAGATCSSVVLMVSLSADMMAGELESDRLPSDLESRKHR